MARAKLREIAAGEDPKEALLDALGDISGVEIFHDQVMVATYIEPEKTPGGVFLPDRTLAENRFQGKLGLVLKKGPLAFKDDPVNGVFFGDVDIEIGQWVFFRPADGMELFSVDRTGGVPCRIFRDRDIKGRVSDPTVLW
jgi:co-chaperonin GroES (HSP10)